MADRSNISDSRPNGVESHNAIVPPTAWMLVGVFVFRTEPFAPLVVRASIEGHLPEVMPAHRSDVMFIVKNRALGVLAALLIAAGFVGFSALFDTLAGSPVHQQGEDTPDRQAGTVTAPSLPTAGTGLSVVRRAHSKAEWRLSHSAHQP
jgi:hypothetical protein